MFEIQGRYATASIYSDLCDEKAISQIYKHQGRKPTTLEWWVECRLID